MYIFDLAKVKLSSRKLNYYFYKKKKHTKSSFGVAFLNKVLKNASIIYTASTKKRMVQVYPNFLSLNILVDRSWKDIRLYKNFLQENFFCSIEEASTDSTIFRKDLSRTLLGDVTLKNAFSLLRLRPGVDKDFAVQLEKFLTVFDFNLKHARFFKVFTSKMVLSKNVCEKLQNLLIKTSLSKNYFQIAALIQFINIFKVIFIVEKFLGKNS